VSNREKGETAKRNRRQGKSVEKVVAKLLNGTRLGIFGKTDVMAGPWATEVKHRKKFIGETFMRQAEKNCPEGKVPLVIVHELYQRFDSSLVIIRLKDFISLSSKP
jgi:hypothetical protein